VKDLSIRLDHRPGALADMGEALGEAGVSVEGGGAFATGGYGIAHFLVEDDVAARRALDEAGIVVEGVREVVQLQLDQDRPGQLGLISRRMAEAGVNIEALYTDHAQRLTLVVDDPATARRVARAWGEDITSAAHS
jgi:hypothetical protein